jgi:hypothetical protein
MELIQSVNQFNKGIMWVPSLNLTSTEVERKANQNRIENRI